MQVMVEVTTALTGVRSGCGRGAAVPGGHPDRRLPQEPLAAQRSGVGARTIVLPSGVFTRTPSSSSIPTPYSRPRIRRQPRTYVSPVIARAALTCAPRRKSPTRRTAGGGGGGARPTPTGGRRDGSRPRRGGPAARTAARRIRTRCAATRWAPPTGSATAPDRRGRARGVGSGRTSRPARPASTPGRRRPARRHRRHHEDADPHWPGPRVTPSRSSATPSPRGVRRMRSRTTPVSGRATRPASAITSGKEPIALRRTRAA